MKRCRRGPDGKTAYELRKARKFARALPHFAEKILFMIPGVAKSVRTGVTSSTWAQREACTRFEH